MRTVIRGTGPGCLHENKTDMEFMRDKACIFSLQCKMNHEMTSKLTGVTRAF